MTSTETPVNNGGNVEALLGAREARTEAPEAAQCEWRATCDWQTGTHRSSAPVRGMSAAQTTAAPRKKTARRSIS